MKTEYVVIDHDGNVSYSAKDETPETFASFRKAEARAKELAASNPGETIGIYELTGKVKVPLGNVESHRKHPIEHYS